MRNVFIAINIVMALAVGTLYYLHFKGNQRGPAYVQAAQAMSKMQQGNLKVVFINNDSLMEYNTKFKKMAEKLEADSKAAENALQSQEMALEAEYRDLMTKAQAGTINADAAQAKEQQIMTKGKQMQMKKEMEANKLMQAAEKATEDMQREVSDYFKNNKAKYGNYDMVIGFKKNGQFLYINDSLDITKMVIEDMNAAYTNEK
jgi:outer membrane protein